MRAVLDTNVLVRATGDASGPARELLLYFERPQHVLVLSAWLLDEVRRVLQYPRLAAIHRLTEEDVGAFVTGLAQIAEIVELQGDGGPHAAVSDPKDVPILETAVVGKARVLCTRDRHLYEPTALDFCHEHGIEVMDDLQLLARLRGSESRRG